MAITYNRTNWQNKVTPVNETNMNNIEQGIVDCAEAINAGSGSTITVDDTLSETSTNPVQNKVIYTALGEKLECTPITFTTVTNNEHIVELLTYIREHQTADTIKMYYLSAPVNFNHIISATDSTPAYSVRTTVAAAITALYKADGSIKINSIYSNGGMVILDSNDAITAISPTTRIAFDYNETDSYRPVALNTMKLYVADAPDTISTLVGAEYTFDFSKGQMLTANIERSNNTTLIFGVTGNNNAKYVGRTISACITNTSASSARTITFDSPTGITRAVGVESGSDESLSIPALRTVKLNATLLKTAAGFVVYIEYKQIN